MQQGKAKKKLAKKKARYWKKTKRIHRRQDKRWKNKRLSWRIPEFLFSYKYDEDREI